MNPRSSLSVTIFSIILLTISNASAVEWSTKNNCYLTKAEIPKGTEVRIRVKSPGRRNETASIVEYLGRKLGVQWHVHEEKRNPVEREIIAYTLTKNMRIGIITGGANYRNKLLRVEKKEDYFEMKFDRGWVLHVKLVEEDF